VGMILAVGARGAAKAEAALRKMGERPWRIGTVVGLKRGGARVQYR